MKHVLVLHEVMWSLDWLLS